MGQEEETNQSIVKTNGVANEPCNGVDEVVSGSRLLSLLASKDRDFLISSINGTQVKISDLEGKVIGIYFSANWNPPCQKFTLLLSDVYEQLKNYNPGFEIVFVSSDEDKVAFDNYFASMPWLAVPFSDLDTRRALNSRFDVEGIPSLIILQPNNKGEDSIIEEGVEFIHRYGIQAYPFTREKLGDLAKMEKEKHENQCLKDLLTNHQRDYLVALATGEKVPVTSLLGKTVGLYFSAQWCSPGAKFTPKLASVYQDLTSNEGFEIVFVSSDHDQNAFDSHFQTMPWLALPFNDPNIKALAQYFDVQGIPSLVIIGPDGKTVTKLGRNLINLYQENAYPFTKDRIESLERQMDEEAKELPKSEFHSGHRHELTLVSEGNGGGPFICCDCDEQGSGWAYQCMECGYEVHPKCVKAVDHGSLTAS